MTKAREAIIKEYEEIIQMIKNKKMPEDFLTRKDSMYKRKNLTRLLCCAENVIIRLIEKEN